MAAERSQFLLEMKEIKPEDVIAGYKAARAIPILDLLDGFLKGDPEKTIQWSTRSHITDEEFNTISEWAKVYFRDILQLRVEGILGTAFFPKSTARELIILGLIYFNGLNVAMNRGVAFHFYTRAADKEDAHGLYLVGFCQQYGYGVDKNITEARKNLLKACSNGSLGAANQLGMLIEDEFQDEVKEALHYYTIGAAEGVAAALRNLGLCYKVGVLGVKMDLDMARKLFAASAFNGDPAGIRSYGLLMPYDEKWKYIRLGVTSDRYVGPDGGAITRIRDELERRLDDPVPALTYHATFALKETAKPEQLVQLKKAFFNLCETKPEAVERLSKELGDTGDDLLSLLDETQKEMLALLFACHDETNFLLRPLFKIVLGYLDFSIFLSPYILEKEKIAKDMMKTLLSLPYRSSLFFKSAASAERGEISYQKAVRNAFS